MLSRTVGALRVRILFCVMLASAAGCRKADDGGGTRGDGTRSAAVESLGARFDGGRKWAVIIGINKYLDPKIGQLRYCVADARRLSQTLIEKCGYDEKRILLITDDQTKDHLIPLAINLRHQIAQWLKNAERGDTVLVSYAGHGFLSQTGEGYLAPKDCERDHLALTGYRIEELRSLLSQCQATQKVLMLDCCHAGGVRSAESPGPSSQEVGGAFQRAEGLITLASCRKDEVSQEWDAKQHGLFTYFVVEGLAGAADYDRNGIVDSDELYRYTVEEVPTTAQRELNGRQQTPVRLIGTDVVGVFALARVGSTSPPPVQRHSPQSQPPPLQMRPESSRPGPPAQEITNTIGMKLRLIPAGEFMMGAPESEKDRLSAEGPVHRVRITKPFYLGEHEVTQAEYEAVMGSNPSQFKGANLPVETVSWEEAMAFCRKLSAKEGQEYRLPTEAEWEYACRGGTTTPFSFGSVLNGDNANCDGNFPYGTETKGAYRQQTAPVGSYKPNAFGLYDMHGNVWEWCSDWYDEKYYEGSPSEDPPGAATGSYRVFRGGSWDSYAWYCRAAIRNRYVPSNRNFNLGFRLARAVSSSPSR